MVEGVGAWEREKQLPPLLCPSPPENEGSVAPAAEEVWGGTRGFTPGCDHGEDVCVTCWAPLFSRDKAPRLSTAPTSPTPPAPLAGWRWRTSPSTHARHRVFVLDDDLPQEAPLIVLVHGEAGRHGPASRAQRPWMAWWGEEERSAPADSGPWSLVTTGYPGRQPSPPAMWVGPSPRSPEGRDGADRLLSGCPVGNLPPGPLLFPHRPRSCHLWTTSSLLRPLERRGGADPSFSKQSSFDPKAQNRGQESGGGPSAAWPFPRS